jgi:hypothetical protein
MDWIKNNLPLFTALVAAFSAIFGGVVAAAAKFGFDFYLSETIKRRWEIVKVKRRYDAPIIRAVDDFAGRLENLDRFLQSGKATIWLREITDQERAKLPFDRYYAISILFLFIRMIAWIEVLKREQIFLDFTSIEETRRFNCYLDLIYQALSMGDLTSNEPDRTKLNYWIYWHHLAAIGNAALIKEDGALRCLSFQEFCELYKEGPSGKFYIWVQEIGRFFIDLSSAPDDKRWQRLQILWFCLDCFLDFVDPHKVKITRPRILSHKISPELKQAALKVASDLRLSLTRSNQ